jgi:hypothetical protein
LWLVHNGVPFDLAFQLDEMTRTAFSIIFSQFHGGKFDWGSMRFVDPAKG